MLQTSRPRPAPYGAACSNCSQTKCRCVRQGSGRCERCQRLDKECRPVCGRRNLRAAPKKTQLEEKIDGLVSLLTSTGQHTSIATESPAQIGGSLSVSNGVIPIHINPDGTSNTSSLPPPTFPRDIDTAPGAELDVKLSAGEQEECLRIFQTRKLKHFPLIYIPSTSSVHDMRTEKPFVWLCVMAVSTRSTSQQAFLCNLVRRELAEKMIYSLEKSLDLLFGILICIFWGNFQVQRRPFLSLYTQFAISLVFDLGLNKPAPKDADTMSDYRFHLSQVQPTRTMEGRRAVLASFVASSVVSLRLGRIDALRWTEHMDECLEKLTEAPEWAGDSLLALLVRSQLISEKASRSPWHNTQSGGGEAAATVPAEFYRKVLLAQLHELKQKIPPALLENDVLLLNMYDTELRIHEAALSPCAVILSESCSFYRLESLHACLVAANSWFEVFFTIPPAEYVGFTFATFSQLGSSAGALYKLSILEDGAWDRVIVRRTADILAIADRLAQNLEQVRTLAGLECDGGEEDIFTRVAGKIKTIMRKWAEKISVDFTGLEFPISTAQGVEGSNPVGDWAFRPPDDAWWTDILEPCAW
ncbi:hypothetical protein BKA61DRAFT_603464 [Leptodontidium sp. MPI-SDFR-AT-0119]|nr:hypothetical protein BKA61DRAFT_603464 [Leptodontidium sp. MPI-SDFR-AT-0119]